MSMTFPWRGAWLLALALTVGALAAPAAAFDVLLGSSFSRRISQVDGATGALEGLFVPPCALPFSTSRGPRLGPDGRIYVGTNGAVYRIDATTGAFVDAFVSGLPGTVYFTVVAPDGSIWGTLNDGGNALFHASSSTGALLGPLVPTPSPTGIAVGPDGNLYVGSSATGQISRFNPTTGAFIDVFGTAPGPTAGLSLGPDGKFYAALFTLNDIGRFDGTTGAYLGSIIPPGDVHPSSPRGPTWGPDGNLWVGAFGTGELLRYDGVTGAFLGVVASGLEFPGAPCFVPDLPSSFGTLPLVGTTSGPLAGFLECDVRKYLGVPYAEAPTGALRWKRPVRKAASPTALRVLSNGPICPQLNGASSIGSEDCLSLSIWRPDSPPATPLPVLFYIHGGGLVTGSASGAATEGSNFAQTQNAIVVEPQYRLGALGFFGLPGLAAEDPNASTGNYGFLDQLEALRWVRDNIAAFGGDPNQITIAGQSAGGWSVCALMASPLSDGLFRAGIVQSGQCMNARPLTVPTGSPVLNDPFFGATIYGRSGAVATGAGCAAGAGQLACLRALPASSLVQALAAQPHSIDGLSAANPAIDGYVLTEQPLGLLRQGAADHRPLVIGSVANETTYFTQGLDPNMPSPIYDLLVRLALGNTRADALLPLYPAASYAPPADAFRTLLDDAGIVCPTLDTADAITAGGSPAWVYHVTFPPTYGPTSTQAALRTFHTLDLYYLFGTYPRLGSDYGILTDADDAALSDSIQGAWGSFVKTGVPSTSTAPAWPVYAPATPGDLASVSVLRFDSPNSTVTGALFRSGRCAALVPIANLLDPDRDIATYDEDNCPSVANTGQADAETDTVGDACDNCMNAANPRVASDYLTTNPWATLTGGQRDDDHDGFGNQCDANFIGPDNELIGPSDLAQYRSASGKSRELDVCGAAPASLTQPCAKFDLNGADTLVGPADLAVYRTLSGKAPGPKCTSCPLACSQGTTGSCGP